MTVSLHSASSNSSDAGPGTVLWAFSGMLLGAMFLGLVVFITNQWGTDEWRERVVSSWLINLFSFAAFGATMMLLLARRKWIQFQKKAYSLDLLSGGEETLILPEDALECRRKLRELTTQPHDYLLVQLLNAASQRARANWSAEDVNMAVQSQAELIQGHTDTQYASIRYLTWAIPPIGFIGTVLGIGEAMGAIKPVSGDTAVDPLTLAAGYLHMAFDTTFVALILSVIVMFFYHHVQARDDALIINAVDWCMKRFVYRMHIPKGTES
jgi:biopolymer transport protein ExbB/TolQ